MGTPRRPARRLGAVAFAGCLLAGLLSGCGGHGAQAVSAAGSSALTPSRAPALTMTQVRSTLHRMGFTLLKPAKLPAGPLRAFHGYWSQAGDGGVQNVFFFHHGRFVGVAHDPNFRAVTIKRQNGRKVTITQYRYRPGDANCCPSGGTRDYSYTWKSGRLVRMTGGGPSPAPTAPPASPSVG